MTQWISQKVCQPSKQVTLRFFVTALILAGNKSGHLSRFVSFCTLAHRVPLECGNAKKTPGVIPERPHLQILFYYLEQPYAVQNDNQLFAENWLWFFERSNPVGQWQG
ncbi:hypothetical protein [Brevibacillus sp. HB2.2]|uniref:hypothetical protein n=1 Tax=Brevibacillus sp. HB2.2 TaxID=2738846 RepID=UPI00156BD845|nr:hypothetical protein [Brevibacillus sp. HB2.2]NRS47202.1 hypothetical protein [Brevibacillus sp. HB2.2]